MVSAQGISPHASLSQPLTGKMGATVHDKAGLEKLKNTAKEFEATFLSMLLKEMRQPMDEEEGGLFPGDSGDVQGGLFDLFMSRHLAHAGGIGLAAYLERQMHGTSATKPVAPTTDALPTDVHPAHKLLPATSRR
jgi:flagellar protein FlgJ